MNEIQDKLELNQIGGEARYKAYLANIRAYLQEHPNSSDSDISYGAHVPLVAVRRALREINEAQDNNNDKQRIINGLRDALNKKSNIVSNESKLVVDLKNRRDNFGRDDR